MLKRRQYRAIYRALLRARAALETKIEIERAAHGRVREWSRVDLAEVEAALRALEAIPLDVADWKASPCGNPEVPAA